MSIELEAEDGSPLPVPLPGQYLTLRIPDAGDPAPLRSYSLSGGRRAVSDQRQTRGTRPREPLAAPERPCAGSVIEVAAPRGDFYLGDDAAPVVLVSAGIGATPVLAMLHALAAARQRPRNLVAAHHPRCADAWPSAGKSTELIESLPNARQRVFYTADVGRPDQRRDRRAGPASATPPSICAGPTSSWTDMRGALAGAGIDPARIHTELFGALPPINPGITDAPHRAPHLPEGPAGTGPAVSFSRSGITVNWSENYGSILELAEACDVPTRFSCRSGVCHICVTPLIEGTVNYTQTAARAAAGGNGADLFGRTARRRRAGPVSRRVASQLTSGHGSGIRVARRIRFVGR